MTISPTSKIVRWLFGITGLGVFTVLPSPASPTPSLPQEGAPRALLPKESFDSFEKHALSAYDSSNQLEADLRLSVQDERVLLHLPKRGFPWLVALLDSGSLYSYAGSDLFVPERNLKSGSKEEVIAGELLASAMLNRLMANRYACFHLIEKLAPSSEAMRLEAQAKELTRKIGSRTDDLTESEFLNSLESIREFFDRLKDLPQMTPEEFAHERAENAVLAPAEYLDDSSGTVPPDKKKWPDQPLDRQQKWAREGYLLAYSESSGPDDFARPQMVIKPLGGVFEACQSYTGSHFGPDSYESKLSAPEIRALGDYLMRMPPSDAVGAEIHFIISFLNDGNWVTRTYRSLPAGNPFQPLLSRMFSQSTKEWRVDPAERAEFLMP